MEQKKLLHPSVDVLRVDGTDKEALEFAMVLLHDLGWLTQQCGVEHALERMKSWHDRFPELFIRGCANGAAVLHKTLGRTNEEP
jgi:hypothetical protein